MHKHPTFYHWLGTFGKTDLNGITRFEFDVEVCGTETSFLLLSAPPGYVRRRVVGKKEQRERMVRPKVGVVLRSMNERRTRKSVRVRTSRRPKR